jgi:hypothetical protein
MSCFVSEGPCIKRINGRNHVCSLGYDGYGGYWARLTALTFKYEPTREKIVLLKAATAGKPRRQVRAKRPALKSASDEVPFLGLAHS